MWRATGASVVGTSHARGGKPCQDCSNFSSTFVGASPAVVIAISDGAGSARLSDVGSRASVDFLLGLIPRRISHPLEANYESVKNILSETIDHLKAVAAEHECKLADLACTVLFAILTEFGAFVAQVGDGAWVIQQNGAYAVPIWPSNGEYVNETTFITSVDWQEALNCHFAFGNVTAVAGLTDGLERVALQWATRSAFAPFFDPLLAALRATGDKEQLVLGLRDFLRSERFATRTDDDKTLVLACHHRPLLLKY